MKEREISFGVKGFALKETDINGIDTFDLSIQ